MKKPKKKARGHKVSNLPETSTAAKKKVMKKTKKMKEENKSQAGEHQRLNLPTTMNNEVEKHDPMPIYYMDVDGRLKIHSVRSYGEWKISPFIFALEEIQQQIQNGEYTRLEDCFKCGWFEELSIEDQVQLQEIAGWYLYDRIMQDLHL